MMAVLVLFHFIYLFILVSFEFSNRLNNTKENYLTTLSFTPPPLFLTLSLPCFHSTPLSFTLYLFPLSIHLPSFSLRYLIFLFSFSLPFCPPFSPLSSNSLSPLSPFCIPPPYILYLSPRFLLYVPSLPSL